MTLLDTETAAASTSRSQLAARLVAYQRQRGGNIALAIHDVRNNSYWGFYDSWRNETLSIVKVLILATVLRRCQERGIAMTSTQKSQAYAMITRSDNTAANSLLTWAGVANVRRVAGLYGLTSTYVNGGTYAGGYDWWGYSTTNARDQIRLLNGVMYGTTVLTYTNREYLKSLMRQVVSSQRWGVSVPPLPSSNAWWTKNGWGPRSGGYRLNSIGHISGNGRNYNAAILTRAPGGFYYGLDTINGVSRILYDALATPLT
ncbi:serine hydrolase [Calidifontibacter sp. DB0510]|uniref:Serine hydrolase n=1 Tax=Metallococcus carri TaxID=1656884 RepID=A0A967AXC4_9MICO|nr:serine hydrolase [Metallococcus carri]NHN54172.1 serine hydrolase [Metallococcus carri]NOP36988.1 hypothetical protein [Calidifontibacter sp. DB2511S]